MLTFIPLEHYSQTYYFFMAIIVVMMVLHCSTASLNTNFRSNIILVKSLGVFSLLFTTFYMGLRPISGHYFGDMGTYYFIFEQFKFYGMEVMPSEDRLFYIFVFICSQIMEAHTFFLVCVIIYILPLFIISLSLFKKYWFYSFLFLIISFSFWSYGTNGIRNGIATSLFLLVFIQRNTFSKGLILLISIGIHNSMLLPVCAYLLANMVNNTKLTLLVYISTIPFSLIVGSTFQSLVGRFISDPRVHYLTENNNDDVFSSTGFRWDFLTYSIFAVVLGWFFIQKKHFNDRLYSIIYRTYLISNGFWILVIYANFSNRFAYLSWFMMALVVIYPLLKDHLFKNQHKRIGILLSGYFLFTFFMNVILGA